MADNENGFQVGRDLGFLLDVTIVSYFQFYSRLALPSTSALSDRCCMM